MLGGTVVIWLLLNGLMFYVTRLNIEAMPRKPGEGIILAGGVAFPVVVLTALLWHGLTLMPGRRAAGDALRVHVTAGQWCWRVEFWPEGASHSGQRDPPAGR